MTLVDTVARAAARVEVPLGILTALVGGRFRVASGAQPTTIFAMILTARPPSFMLYVLSVRTIFSTIPAHAGPC